MRNICPFTRFFKYVSVALLLIFCNFSDNRHAFAQTPALDELFIALSENENTDYQRIEEKIWKEWRKSGSDSVDFILERGMMAMNEGDLNSAIGHFNAAIDHAPDFAEAWNMRATAFFMMGEFGLSVSDIQQTLVLNPRHFGALGGMAMILEQTQKPKSALLAYEKLLEVHPHHESANEAVERLNQLLQGEPL